MPKEFELTRRRVLGGIGTIGVASVGAGLGTSAYLNDTESFEENTITAGTLDMSVTATVEAASDYWSDAVELSATADGDPVTSFQVDDVKPGDWGIICFDIDIGENPGYVQVMTENLASAENGYTEPEPVDENGEGELEEAMIAEVYSGFDAGADSDPPRSHLSGLDATTPEGTTLAEAYETYSTGVTLGGSEEPAVVGSGESMATFCLLLWIPAEVGNEIQGDSVAFDLVFHAEQVRNNDDPFSA
ncbi:SipW-dependent-type signal peptide-containing protein [Halobacterium litoreum]|uniref:SipW-dependent-type signal peptide-containing protein n=1 Tax=Halobacterium litoreum TaxID=2039234 RepID=A0ABD5NCN6_9EURY|nr:SipW-dependent-type signal peptide-containing protein [Halobacterium litoreum]UHH14056.1 CalY family protein [Halobacterium litoreum]